jgi:pyruvate kinase
MLNIENRGGPVISTEQVGLDSGQVRELASELIKIHQEMSKLESQSLSSACRFDETHQESARNLVHYMALRRHDIRGLQESLTTLGLSSLGRSEAHIKLTVEILIGLLHQLWHLPSMPDLQFEEQKRASEWGRLLEEHTANLLGPRPPHRSVRIMVTMPGEAAEDYDLVRDLVSEGMDCMRINCAHDGVEEWDQMIWNLRRARRETGRQCQIMMDLPGPKLRTGPIKPGPQVVVWRPHRDSFGNVTAPARIWMTPSGSVEAPPDPADACLPVTPEWISRLAAGDVIRFFDARGASRRFTVTESAGDCRWAESYKTSYLMPGAVLQLEGRSGQALSGLMNFGEGKVGDIAPRAEPIMLKEGDSLILTRGLVPGRPAILDPMGQVIAPARIGVTLPEIFPDVRTGESIWLDDGKIGGTIVEVKTDELEVEIVHTRPGGDRLMSDKGINLPDSNLKLPALTQCDLEYLEYIAEHADLVGYSFVRRASDVYELQRRLDGFGSRKPGIVLKIETRTAFERLPELLLAAMRSSAAGVMIARGDLAVECGYERLAEVQEEMLSICEAAHMPVIWATQVLERLAKGGVPSRAEITDAAMGERAECVMLNKGPYVVEAVRALDDILRRMQGHQAKKRSILRSLKIAGEFKAAARAE